MSKPFEHLSTAEVDALSPERRRAYESWFTSWMESGFASGEADTFDIEVEQREGWGYQLEEPRP